GDGILELVAGNVIYKVTLTNLLGEAGNSLDIWREADTPAGIAVGDGFTAMADVDLEGDPDVVVVRNANGLEGGATQMYVWDGQTGEILGSSSELAEGGGSQPFIGDIDGDGWQDIVFVTDLRMNGYHYDDDSATIVGKWALDTSDASGLTSRTLFDFNNDGAAELVYRDQEQIHIIDGTTAADLACLGCESATGTEMPVVADIDGTGMAE